MTFAFKVKPGEETTTAEVHEISYKKAQVFTTFTQTDKSPKKKPEPEIVLPEPIELETRETQVL